MTATYQLISFSLFWSFDESLPKYFPHNIHPVILGLVSAWNGYFFSEFFTYLGINVIWAFFMGESPFISEPHNWLDTWGTNILWTEIDIHKHCNDCMLSVMKFVTSVCRNGKIRLNLPQNSEFIYKMWNVILWCYIKIVPKVWG